MILDFAAPKLRNVNSAKKKLGKRYLTCLTISTKARSRFERILPNSLTCDYSITPCVQIHVGHVVKGDKHNVNRRGN